MATPGKFLVWLGISEKILEAHRNNHNANDASPRERMKLHLNSSPRFGQPLDPRDGEMLGVGVIDEVREYMAPLKFDATPLHRMNTLARSLDIAALLIKDESGRATLGSFKALGGAYAVIRLVLAEAERILGRRVPPTELNAPTVQEVARRMTVACATDGNHGRSVAAGARLTGCSAVIFIHSGVSEARAEAMRSLGAQVTHVTGSYDDAVAKAAAEACDAGWQIVSDTSWPGYEAVPLRVMQGYLLMVDEVLRQCGQGDCLPTHVFLQAGVGGFAAAVVAHLVERLGLAAPRCVVVEPERAACLFHSAIAQRPVRIAAGAPTMMAMLECYEPSRVAWRILERRACAFATITEAAALRTMKRLAAPLAPDPFVLSGESGGAGLAGLAEVCADARARELLHLDERSVALVFNTEGATDRALYESLLASPDTALSRPAAPLN